MTFKINNIRMNEKAGFLPVRGAAYHQNQEEVARLGQELLRALGPSIGRANDVHVDIQEDHRLTLTNRTTGALFFNRLLNPDAVQDQAVLRLCEEILNVANRCFEPEERAPARARSPHSLRGRASPVPEEDGRLDDLNGQIQDLQEQLDDASRRNRGFEKTIQALEKRCDEWEENDDANQAEINTLREALHSAQDANKTAQHQLEDMQGRLDQGDREYGTLVKINADLVNANVDQAERLAALTNQFDELQERLNSDCERLEGNISDLQSEIARKKGEISALKADKGTALDAIQKLTSLSNAQNEEMERLQSRLGATNERIGQLQQQLEKLGSAQKAKDALVQQLEQAHGEKTELAERLATEKQGLSAKLAEVDGSKAELLKRIEELNQQHKQDQKLLFQARTTVSDLQTEIARLREELDDAKRLASLRSNSPLLDQNGAEQEPSENIGILAAAEAFLGKDAEERLDSGDNIAALQSKLDLLTDQHSEALTKIDDLEEGLARAEQDKTQLTKQLERAKKSEAQSNKIHQDTAKGLELILAAHQATIDTLNDLLASAEARIKELTQELETQGKANAEVEDLQTKLEIVQKSKAELATQISKLEQQNKTLAAELTLAKERAGDLQEKLSATETENSQLTKQVADLSTDLDSVKDFALKQGATIEQLEGELSKEKLAGEVAAASNAKRLEDAHASFEEQFRLVEVGRALLAKKLQEAQDQAEADRAEADRQMQSLVALYEQAHKKSAETQAQLSKLREMYENALEAAKEKQTEAETQRDEIASKATQEIKALAASIKELQEQADQDSGLLGALTAKLQEAQDTISRHEEHILKLRSERTKARADLKSQQTTHADILRGKQQELDQAVQKNAILQAEITKTKSTAKKAMEDIAAAAAVKEQNKSLEQRVSSLQQEITSAKVASAEATFKLERAKEDNETLRKAQTEELAKRDKAIAEARLELREVYQKMKAPDFSGAPAKKA